MKIEISYKSYIFVKVLRAKLTGTCEGDGIRGENIEDKFLIKKAFLLPLPSRVGLILRPANLLPSSAQAPTPTQLGAEFALFPV